MRSKNCVIAGLVMLVMLFTGCAGTSPVVGVSPAAIHTLDATPSITAVASPSVSENAEGKASLEARIAKAKAAGKTVVIGTAHVLTTDELLRLQNKANPNPGSNAPNDRYIVVSFDQETEIPAYFSGDPMGNKRSVAVQLIAIPSDRLATHDVDSAAVKEWQKYNGKTVAVAFDRALMPSDTSLPIGEPTVSNAELLGVK